MKGQCSECKEPVNYPPSRFCYKNVYCGRVCYGRATAKRVVKEETREKLSLAAKLQWGPLENNVTCSSCGTEFHRPQCELDRKRHYCNAECKKADRTRTYGVGRRCKQCDWPGVRAGRKFCSQVCAANFRKKPYIVKNGYRLVHVPTHPNSDQYGYVREHRVVMERVLGRLLSNEEVVHHRNGDKMDNGPSNLELFDSNSAHLKSHHA